MQQIQGSQIRAARAILNWSQEELARRAGLAVTTVRNIEGGSSLRGKTMIILRDVFEKGGLEFTEREGVRRCVEEINLLFEPDSCQQLFEDMLRTVRDEGDEILVCVFSYAVFEETLCLTERDGAARLKRLSNFARIKCLVPNGEEVLSPPPSVQIRTVDIRRLRPTQYYVYGNRHALIVPHGNGDYRFCVFRSPLLALAYRTHFQDTWHEETSEGVDEKARKDRRAVK